MLAGTLILVLGIIAATEVVSDLAGYPLQILPFKQTSGHPYAGQWIDPPVQDASVLLVLVGLALIALALVPARGRWTVLHTDDPGLLVGMERSALRGTVAGAARNVEGVRSARVVVGRNGVRVRVRAHPRSPATLRTEVRAAVEHRLAELGPFHTLTVATAVRHPRR